MKKIYGVFWGIAVLSLFSNPFITKAESLPVSVIVGSVDSSVIEEGTLNTLISLEKGFEFDYQEEDLESIVNEFLIDESLSIIDNKIVLDVIISESDFFIEKGDTVIFYGFLDEEGNVKYSISNVFDIDGIEKNKIVTDDVSKEEIVVEKTENIKQLRPNYVSDRFRAVVDSIFSIFK